jgi:xanthine dehydrogenase accessory factor
MSFDLDTLRAAVAREARVVRVVVTDVRGSAPREVGAAMLIWADGQAGTIGGGRLEWDATDIARQTLRDGAVRVRRFALGPDLGQCCGGAAQVAAVLYTGDTLPAPGLVALALEDRPRPATPTLLPARKDGWFFESTEIPRVPVWIHGAGHVGRAIVDLLALQPDFDVTWIDTAPERFPPEAKARCLPAPDPARALALAPRNAHHLILTYSHAMDLALCHAALRHGFASAGLIGSQTKWARFRKRLSALGHSEDQIARITCPIGDPRLGRRPEAIALGVVTGLVLSATAQTVTCKELT